MKKVNCNIIRDILPLYVDGVASQDTKDMVEEHLQSCENCRNELAKMQQILSLPSNQAVRMKDSHLLKGLQRHWRKKKIIIACVTIFITAAVLLTGYQVVQNVGAVHDVFFPMIQTIVSSEEGEAAWQTLHFDTEDYLIFDSVFFAQEVVNDANSDGAVVLRIKDAAGDMVMDPTIILPGEAVSLHDLQRNQSYLVEVKIDSGSCILNFV